MKKRNIVLYSFLLIGITLSFIQKEQQIEILETNQILMDRYFRNPETVEESYLGILEIPSINLKRGFFHYDSPLNTVSKNIEVINPSCSPKEPCYFILASHSGNSNISFFNKLNQLKIGDEATLFYEQEMFRYRFIKKENVLKDGTLSFLKTEKPVLILSTCNKEIDSLQEVYYFELML